MIIVCVCFFLCFEKCKRSFDPGHDASVTSVHWSHDNSWLITSSDDKTARVWSLGLPDPVMTFNMVQNNFRSDKEGGLKPSKVRRFLERREAIVSLT